jgi:hypothetical protein
MRGFLKSLLNEKRRIEVVIVSHGSFLRGLANDGMYSVLIAWGLLLTFFAIVKFQDVVMTSCVFGDDENFKEITRAKLASLRRKGKN